MAARRFPVWILILVLVPAVLGAFVLGIWGFFAATARTLHPDPEAGGSVARLGTPAEWADRAGRARTIVRASLLDQNLPGLSLAVGAGDTLVWAEGFGSADLGSHELDFTGQLALDTVPANDRRSPVTPDTRFRIVGVSMALTSAAVGLLLEDERLNLDADIRTYVPEFPEKPWPVTLRQLMAHQAGIQNDGGDEAPLMTRCDRTLDGLVLDNFAAHSLHFQPGTGVHYSTYGWILVSAAIEAAAREPFFGFMRTKIFEPLGMADTLPESWNAPIENRATFYHPRYAADTRYGPDLAREGDHSCFAGGGAFLSTPSDLVRFAIALRRGSLLKPATVDLLQTPQRLASGAATDYALGWKVETAQLAGQPVRLVRQDDRRSVGASTTLLIFPERDLVVAVMSNTTFADTSTVATKVAEIFAER
jgi:CubicO group peptidase (beta-lactamase class C family)